MRQLPENWKHKKGKLVREYKFGTYAKAINFINKVVKIADDLNHHPDIFNSYTTVVITCYTHDSESVTIQDYALAEAINEIL